MPALADKDRFGFERREPAQHRAHENASSAIDRLGVGVADDEPLPIAHVLRHAAELHRLELHRIPGKLRVEQQATIGVNGEHQTAAGGQRLTVLRRHRDAEFGIEAELAGALK